jgi:glycosyltransferase involved in cell wall biosynthesis
MSALPAISIVTPSFNQGTFIREAILSVRQQGYPNCEQLIIDGGSNDETVAVLRELSRGDQGTRLRWVSEPDGGQAHALNKGFARADGDVIGWLNSDDRYRPGTFHSIATLFAQHPEVDVLYGDYAWMDADGRIQRVRREIEFSPFILLYHRVLYIPTTATFFRRRILDEGNLLDESLHYAMDFEFFVRLSCRGYRFMHMRRLLADFRLHEASKTCSTPDKQLQEHNQIMRRYSPVSDYVKGDLPRGLIFGLLRVAAGTLRYSEKLVRGCYFPQPRSLTSDL